MGHLLTPRIFQEPRPRAIGPPVICSVVQRPFTGESEQEQCLLGMGKDVYLWASPNLPLLGSGGCFYCSKPIFAV